MLRESTIQELKNILNEDYGHDVSQKEAAKIAQEFVTYFNLMLRIQERTKQVDELNNCKAKIYNGLSPIEARSLSLKP